MLAPQLFTERLVLRCLDANHLGVEYLKWMNDDRVTRYLEVRLQPQSGESISQYVQSTNAGDDSILFGIFLRDIDRHIGNLKIGPIERYHSRTHLGLLIGEAEEWGKGFAREAIQAATDYAFEKLGLRKVLAGCYGQNEGSRRAFLKAGYEEVARRPAHWRLDDQRWDDDVMMERLNPDWVSR